MAVSPAEFREAANEGITPTATQLARRTAVNRAYYAAFHSLGAKLQCMADPGTLGDMGCVTHGFIPYALRTFAAKYPDKRQRMAKGAEALKMVNHYESIMSARHLADYDTTSSGDYDPRMVVLHLGRVDRLLKFAASIK